MKIVNVIKCVLVSLLCFAPLAHAAKVVPIEGQPLHSEMSYEDARRLFSAAAAKRGWQIKDGEVDNSLIADLYVRSHYVSVDITLNQSTYDINYRDSENMKYKPDGTIHKKYNGWVRNLNSDIQKQLRAAR
ncbi:hypothetical protein [Vibrio agarivorans]|uniref:hypothetical protein n=1 Tax=Vibrio agarivorans TaxID=153622 RepID=UPI002230E884|nr:hypothetical protein [Vibrio agarivorans]